MTHPTKNKPSHQNNAPNPEEPVKSTVDNAGSSTSVGEYLIVISQVSDYITRSGGFTV